MSAKVDVNEKVTYQGREYVKSDQPAVVGDLLRMLETTRIDITEGAFYEVTRIDASGDPHFIDDDGDDRDSWPDNYDVYKPIENVIINGKQYREVERQAREGERIKIVKPMLSFGHYEKGDELTVASATCVSVDVAEFDDIQINHDEYVVLEPAEGGSGAKPADVDSTYKAGDRVRGKNTGRIYTLKKRDPERDGGCGKAWKVEGESGWIGENQFEKVTDDRLKVGDYARVIGEPATEDDFKAGVRATDAEIEVISDDEAKEAAKWAAIGRKLGEFKAGDIVEVLDKGSSRYENGRAYEVKVASGGIMTLVDGGGIRPFISRKRVKLICPVEQRADLTYGGGDAS